MRIGVIVVNWNGGDDLRRCLEALAAQRRPADRVLVVDNASRDGSLERALPALPAAEALRMPANLGFAAANNAALSACTDCDWVALLNPDAFARPDWLEKLAAAAAEYTAYSAFASQLRQARNEDLLDGAGDVYHVSGLVWRGGHGAAVPAHDAPREVFSPCAAAALYRRDALLEAGAFDERYFCYLEDVDLGFRLRLRGHRCLYVPEAVVLHVGSGTTGRGSDFSTYHGHRNLVWTFFKDMPAALLLFYLPQHLLLNAASVVWFAARGQARTILRAKWDALRGLPAILRQRRTVQRDRRMGLAALRRTMSRGWLTPYAGRKAPPPAPAAAEGERQDISSR